jgi:large subunit ribosomal protein L5
MAARLKEQYEDEIRPALMREFNYRNAMQTPSINKVVINVGVGEALQNSKALDATVRDIGIITGQKPVVTKAKRSIAAFKVRAGNPIGVSITLRGSRMYEFLDRLINIALPGNLPQLV